MERKRATLTRDCEEADRQLIYAKAERDRFRDESNNTSHEIEDKTQKAKAEISALALRHVELISEIENFELRRNIINEDLASLVSASDAYRAQYDNLILEIQVKQTELQELNQRIKEAERLNYETTSRLSEDDAESLAHLHMDLVALNDEVKSKQSWIAEVEKRAAALGLDEANLLVELDRKRQSISLLEESAATAARRRLEALSEIDELELRRKSLADENMEFERNLTAAIAQQNSALQERFQAEIAATEQYLMQKRLSIAELEQQGSSLSEDEVRLRVELDHSRQTLEQVTRNITSAERQRSDMIIEVRALEQRRETLITENIEAERARNSSKSKGAVPPTLASRTVTTAGKPQTGQRLPLAQKQPEPIGAGFARNAVQAIDSALSNIFAKKPAKKASPARPATRKDTPS